MRCRCKQADEDETKGGKEWKIRKTEHIHILRWNTKYFRCYFEYSPHVHAIFVFIVFFCLFKLALPSIDFVLFLYKFILFFSRHITEWVNRCNSNINGCECQNSFSVRIKMLMWHFVRLELWIEYWSILKFAYKC